jgi:hypothetical protein
MDLQMKSYYELFSWKPHVKRYSGSMKGKLAENIKTNFLEVRDICRFLVDRMNKKLTTHLQLVPRSRIRGSIYSLPPYVFIA